MKVKIAKWGNSLAVRLPKAVAEEAGLRRDAEVDVTVEGGDVRMKRVWPIPRYTLEDMVAEMDRLGPGNVPETVDWGPDVGSEILPEDEYSRGEITPERLREKKHAARRR
jgi:antitoxin MazE